jgi:hypothetical protein
MKCNECEEIELERPDSIECGICYFCRQERRWRLEDLGFSEEEIDEEYS